MPHPQAARLGTRSLIALEGRQSVDFLQGILSQDMHKLAPDRALYAALATPQGKLLHDLMVAMIGERILMDCDARRIEALIKKLTLYRLRANVSITPVGEEMGVFALFGARDLPGLEALETPGAACAIWNGVAFRDPRHGGLGALAFLPLATAETALTDAGYKVIPDGEYHNHRLRLGIPDGSLDFGEGDLFLLEANLDALGAIDFNKGCYVGQELTARMKLRDAVRKRLLPVAAAAPLPEPGTALSDGSREVGRLYAVRGQEGFALARLDRIVFDDKALARLKADDVDLRLYRPDWLADLIAPPASPS